MLKKYRCPRRFLTPEEKAELVFLSMEQGWSDVDLAKRYGIHRSMVYKQRTKITGKGVVREKKRATIALLEDITFLLSKNPQLTQPELGALLDLPWYSINYYMNQDGWERIGGGKYGKWVKIK